MTQHTADTPADPPYWLASPSKPKLKLPVGKKLPADLIDAAHAHRDELRALAEQPKPTPASPGTAWDSGDWQAFFDEAAGIAEFDHGLSRAEAEAHAFECCVTEWLNSNLKPSPPGHCVACRRGAQPDDALLPFGTKRHGHAWLHSRCWPSWHADRIAEAIAGLASVGISPARNALDEPNEGS